MKTGVLLINVGTPDSPKVGDVRKYLSEFLNDPYVIDLPWLSRKILVNGLIVPFRAKASSELYETLWTEEGSPLLTNSVKCSNALQELLGSEFIVKVAMRYQSPSIKETLGSLMDLVDRLVVVPMYPQYAESTTRTSLEKVEQVLKGSMSSFPTQIVDPFYNDDGFIRAFAARIKDEDPESFDHVLFSFHGLPERHLTKLHSDGGPCADCACETTTAADEGVCYKAQCYATVRRLAEITGLQKGKYSVGFQSRLDKKWLKPFSDVMIANMPSQGIKRILVVSPSFVADCLETTVEIGIEYKELFIDHGGEDLVMVESLNDHPTWVEALSQLVHSRIVEQ